MKLKVIREGKQWFVVSAIYEPPSPGRVGSGILWATPHATRQQARAARDSIKLQAKGRQ